MEQDEIDIYEKVFENFYSTTGDFEKDLTKKIEDKKKEILNLERNDTILETFKKYLQVGREYSFEEIIKITHEGKHRYEFDIPPEYGDWKKEKKEGIQIFGDLIIWKQILEYAKEVKKGIVFICNDVVKGDWCYLDERFTDKRIKSPREELIKEIRDYAGVRFWMYNQAQFLYVANKQLKLEVSETQIRQISKVLRKRTNNYYDKDSLVYQCDNCTKVDHINSADLELDFEETSRCERSMGDETVYETDCEFTCNNCPQIIEGQFELYEYPVGVKNYQSITLKGAKVIQECDLNINFYEPDDD